MRFLNPISVVTSRIMKLWPECQPEESRPPKGCPEDIYISHIHICIYIYIYTYIYIWNLRVDPKQGFYIIFAVQFLTRLIPMCPWNIVWQVGTRRIMDDVPEEMHGIFCMSASLGESRILSRMLVCGSVLLQPMLCSSLHHSSNLHKCSVANLKNAL